MNILDPRFKYTPSISTDLRKTFARIRARTAAQTAAEEVATDAILERTEGLAEHHANLDTIFMMRRVSGK